MGSVALGKGDNRAPLHGMQSAEPQRQRTSARSSRRSPLLVLVCLLAAWALAGCGYVRVRATPPPATPTLTRPVHLSLPERQATATPVPAAPLPTETPTPTPTPVVYVVQKGDNLLEIAFRYDVDVQALIEVNEIENPRALQIGQRLIIPLDRDALIAAQPTATPTPMPLEIVHLAFHRTPVGSLWCMGEVQNERDEDLDLVQVLVMLYDVDGVPIARTQGFTAVDVVPGHGRAPFALLFAHPPARFATYEVTVLSAEPITHWGRRHRDLVVRDLESEARGKALHVQGTVHNEGQDAVQEVQVVLTAYGAQGEVVAVRELALGALVPGKALSFTHDLVPAAPAVRVEGVAWGLKKATPTP